MTTPHYLKANLAVHVIMLLLISCGSREENREYYEDGQLKSEVPLVEGKREGTMTTYSPTGKLISKHTYNEDSLTGPYEVYFPDGALAEKGRMKNGTRVGKVFQYYPNGKIRYEHYMLRVKGRPFPYYTFEFDSTGRLVSSNKRVDLKIEMKGNNDYQVNVTNLEEFKYDSIKIVVGNFDDDFRPEGRVDSLVITQKVATVNVTKSENQEFLRGYLIRYKTEMRQDTVFDFASYTYFEHPFD